MDRKKVCSAILIKESTTFTIQQITKETSEPMKEVRSFIISLAQSEVLEIYKAVSKADSPIVDRIHYKIKNKQYIMDLLEQ